MSQEDDTIILCLEKIEMIAKKEYILRVIYTDTRIEIHEYKNKKKALRDRDNFRKMENVVSAKMRLKSP